MADKGSVAVELPRLFSRLKRATEDEDDEQALELTKKILELSRDDADALHCQLISLIHLARFDSALELIHSLNKKRKAAGEGGKVYQLEEAYCLYRQEKYGATLSILSTLPPDDVRVMELVAQVAYRQDQYQKAMQTYTHLLNQDKNKQERVANYYAAVFQCPTANESEPALSLADTMEQCFNLACCQLVRGREQQAMQLLHRAESLYREGLEEEGLTEEEIVEEMAVIEVQKGYCFHVQEAVKEAMSCYNSVLKLRPDDPGLVAVLSNNILVLNGDRDVFDSKKKVKVLANEGSSRKLTQQQKQKILFNRCMFALQTNQLEQCRELGAKLKAAQSNSDLAVLAEVALLNREKKTSAAMELLLNHVQSSQAGVQLYATLAQLYLNQGNTGKALAILRSIPAYPRYVGVASTLASQHAHSGEVGVAMDVLDEMLECWMGKGEGQVSGESAFTDLVKQVAKFQLSHSRPEAAAAILERALNHQDNMALRALLISAYSQYDPQRAELASQHLPAFRAQGQVDVDSLEQTPMFRHSRRLAPIRAEAGRVTELVSKTKKRRKRKPRLPKNYDPSVTPDPERWLPLRERSYYRRSRRKGGVAPTARGTQGSSAANANLMSQLDASKHAATKQVTDTAADASSEGQSPRAKPHPQASKKKAKKKKGGKW